MIKLLFSSILGFTLTLSLAQAPNKMSYQFVVRDPNGFLVVEQDIAVRISITIGAQDGSIVFSELHSVQTNSNGAGSLEVGNGSNLTGSIAQIDWGLGSYFLSSEIDPAGGSNYVINGTTQMLSVPFALHASNAPRYRVGDLALGGIIFSVWRGADGEDHGLIASLENIGGNITWSSQYEITASNSSSNGLENLGSDGAGALCEGYSYVDPVSGEVFDDWYLPAIWELNDLSKAALVINNVLANDGADDTIGLLEGLDSGYWSSTEIGSTFAWYVQMSSGIANTNFKDAPYRVRAIRRF